MDLRTVRADRDNEPLTFEVARPMVVADLAVLKSEAKGTSVNGAVSPLKRLTERHHALARLLAVGTPHGQAAIITGYDRSTVSILTNDTSFQELVEFYKGEVHAEYLSMHAQMAGLGADAIAEIRRRLEESPEDLGLMALLDIATKMADRTGNGPTATTKSEVTVTLDLAARMKDARAKAQAAIEASARDITPKAAAE